MVKMENEVERTSAMGRISSEHAETMLFRVVLAITMLCPLLPAFIVASPELLQYNYKKAAIVTGMLIACIVIALHPLVERLSQRRAMWLLFFLGITTKHLLIQAIGLSVFQNSEYGHTLALATGNQTDAILQHVSVFPHWSLTGILMRPVVQLLSPWISPVHVIQYINALVLTLAAIVLFKLIALLTNNNVAAFYGALILLASPTDALYFLMASNEFSAILALLLVIYIYIYITSNYDQLSKLKLALLELLLAVAFFLAQFTKPVSPVIIVAVFIGLLLTIRERPLRKSAVFFALVLCPYLINSLLLSKAYTAWLTSFTGYPVNINQSSHFLFIGLSPDYQTTGNVYEGTIASANFDYQSINRSYIDNVLLNLKTQPLTVLSKIINNFIIEWQDYNSGIRMVANQYGNTAVGPGAFAMATIVQFLYAPTQMYYMGCLLLAVAALAYCAVRLPGKDPSLGLLILALILIGTTMGLSIGEPQERYKCIVMPVVYAFAGIGLSQLLSQAGTLFRRFRK